MANTDNKCATLVVEDHYKDSSAHLQDMFSLQNFLQKRMGNDFENWTLKQISDFWLLNSHCEVDETHEMFDALGGIDDGIGNSVWKNWKTLHSKASEMKISDLSQSDLIELKMEIVDKFHFFMNYALSIGMTAQELYNMYIAKNKENHRRQDDGY